MRGQAESQTIEARGDRGNEGGAVLLLINRKSARMPAVMMSRSMGRNVSSTNRPSKDWMRPMGPNAFDSLIASRSWTPAESWFFATTGAV